MICRFLLLLLFIILVPGTIPSLAEKTGDKNEQVYTLFNLLDWCASKNIKAIDPTGYFFPTYPQVPSDKYIEKFRNRAGQLGIAISGTGCSGDTSLCRRDNKRI